MRGLNAVPARNGDIGKYAMYSKIKFSKIVKRNGEVRDFNPEKIENAIFKAMRAIGSPDRKAASDICQKVLEIISLKCLPEKNPTVECVQDIVEQAIFDSGNFALLKAFLIYRHQHAQIRNFKENFSNVDSVDDYLSEADWKVKESANSAYSLQGLNQHISSKVTSQYWLSKLYSETVSNAHDSGDIHIHDLGFLSVYCVGWDLQDLLSTGFKGVAGKAQAAPPRHLRTALGQIVNFFYTMQGEAAGAQAFSNFDTLLAPYVRYDKLSYEQVRQCFQEFLFNLNVPTRVGFQTPFTNITMDLKVPDFMRGQPVVYAGEIMRDTYGAFQEEMNLVNRAFAELMYEGDASGSLFSFPIPTYNITRDFEWDNPVYEPIWKMTAKYGIPYFSNFVNSDMDPEDVRSMCCRLRLDKRELAKRGGGLFASNPLTGSVGVVTINMARLGYLSDCKKNFYERLRKLMEIAKESLEVKRKTIELYTDKGLYPYSKFYLRNLRCRFGQYWKNHFSTIGINGMNECCMNFLGLPISHPDSIDFSREVMLFMRSVLEEFQRETGNIYNLEATPAESAAYRFALLDTRKYRDIIVANQSDFLRGAKPYYTNSSQLPVNHTDDLFEALRIQDSLQTLYTGGTVFHVFTGESAMTCKAARNMVRKVCENFKLPYITLSPSFSVCPNHGYISGEHFACPKCGERSEVYSRIVGYMRPVSQWNEGKRREFMDRAHFDKSVLDCSNSKRAESLCV